MYIIQGLQLKVIGSDFAAGDFYKIPIPSSSIYVYLF